MRREIIAFMSGLVIGAVVLGQVFHDVIAVLLEVIQ